MLFCRKRRSTFSVIWATLSSPDKQLTQVIEPVEKTDPRPSSNKTTSSPPLSGFSPRAITCTCFGELAVTLSVSWPTPRPEPALCRPDPPKSSPLPRPVPSRAQCNGSETRVRRRRHDTRMAEGHAQQPGLWTHTSDAFLTRVSSLAVCIIERETTHRVAFKNYLTVQPVSAEIHQPAAAMHPLLHPPEHLTCPILRVHPRQQKHVIALSGGNVPSCNCASENVILKAFAFQPAQQSHRPRAQGRTGLVPRSDRETEELSHGELSKIWLPCSGRSNKRTIRFVRQAPDALGLVISSEVLPRTNRRRAAGLQSLCNWIARQRIVGVPGVCIRKHRYPCAGSVRRDHPRERVAFTRRCARPEGNTQTGPSRGLDPVLNSSRQIAHLIPVHTRLSVTPIGSDLFKAVRGPCSSYQLNVRTYSFTSP